jgi:uncharacterized protein YdcH (DUF465 family)
LNLIERFWKYVKSRLRTKYYDRFDVFQERIDSIVNNADKKDKALIDRLIGEKVQLFDEPLVVGNSPVCSFMTTQQAA